MNDAFRHPRRTASRKATNFSARPELVAEARELGINLSDVFERGLQQAIAEARSALWLEENREALESSNAWVEARGLPLAGKRLV
jgi:Post-segregation antitoxin (ccd killing mechanism protein) encoded by the F plasmid